MKKSLLSLLYLGLTAHTTTAISGDGEEYILLKGRVIPIDADVTQIQHLSRSAGQMPSKFDGSVNDNNQGQEKNSFLPLEGIFDKSKVIYERLCTPPDLPGAVESVTSVVDVDSENLTFIIRETSPDNPELIFDTLCELEGMNYRCDMPTQQVDFAPYGLDAVVSIEGTEYGSWKGKRSYIHIPGQSFTCSGSDCGAEPASNFFGTLTEEMPCSSLAVYKFRRESPLPPEPTYTILSNP
jgi:hypothetical protein